MRYTLITAAETLPPALLIFILIYLIARIWLTKKQTFMLFPLIWATCFFILPRNLDSLKKSTKQPDVMIPARNIPAAPPPAETGTPKAGEFTADYFLTPTTPTKDLRNTP